MAGFLSLALCRKQVFIDLMEGSLTLMFCYPTRREEVAFAKSIGKPAIYMSQELSRAKVSSFKVVEELCLCVPKHICKPGALERCIFVVVVEGTEDLVKSDNNKGKLVTFDGAFPK